MRQKLLVLATVVTAVIALVVYSWIPAKPTKATAIAVTTLVDDGREITSYASYANLRLSDPDIIDRSIQEIRDGWHPGGIAMLIEAWHFQRSIPAGAKILTLLHEKSEQTHGSIRSWRKWLWSQEYEPHPQYALFKSAMYATQDKRFTEYFQETDNARIRLDEILWGGVARDGIPPLKNPKMIPAKDADYLDDSNEVFGVIRNGDARCYPKRILAWHEMFKDTIAGESVCGVY